MTDTKKDTGSFYKKVNQNPAKNVNAEDPVSASEKRKTLLALLLALGILQTLYMNLAAFFPIYASDHYPWVGSGQVGFVLA